MGAQTMGSNGGTQKPRLDGLSRKGSLYDLTLDEVQLQLGDLGKPFSSMNLDELLKSVDKAEANQGMNRNYTELTQLASGLMRKTVDEAWQDIQQGRRKKTKNISDNDRTKQPTFGEMTLEDFLVKAGIVVESSHQKKNQEQSLDPQKAWWINYEIPEIQQQNVLMAGHFHVQQPLSIAGNRVMDVGYVSSTPLMGTLSDTHMSGRKRLASGDVMERIVERKQTRMIKNRESATRSRERKQAYTHELENKVSRLEEENERLRRQKEVEKVIQRVPPPKPKYQLRRTTSAPF